MFNTLLTRVSSYSHWRIMEFDLMWQTSCFLQNHSLSFFKQCHHWNIGWLKFLWYLKIQSIVIGSCANGLSRRSWCEHQTKKWKLSSITSLLLSPLFIQHPPENLLLLIFIPLKCHISLNQKYLKTTLAEVASKVVLYLTTYVKMNQFPNPPPRFTTDIKLASKGVFGW